MDTASFVINDQLSRYRSALRTWVGTVRNAPNTAAALDSARRVPIPGPLIRCLSARDRSQSMQEVELVLMERLKRVGCSKEAMPLVVKAECLTSLPRVTRWARETKFKVCRGGARA